MTLKQRFDLSPLAWILIVMVILYFAIPKAEEISKERIAHQEFLKEHCLVVGITKDGSTSNVPKVEGAVILVQPGGQNIYNCDNGAQFVE